MIAMFSDEEYELIKAFVEAALDSYDDDLRKTNTLAMPIGKKHALKKYDLFTRITRSIGVLHIS